MTNKWINELESYEISHEDKIRVLESIRDGQYQDISSAIEGLGIEDLNQKIEMSDEEADELLADNAGYTDPSRMSDQQKLTARIKGTFDVLQESQEPEVEREFVSKDNMNSKLKELFGDKPETPKQPLNIRRNL
jgi:hypothetical protein